MSYLQNNVKDAMYVSMEFKKIGFVNADLRVICGVTLQKYLFTYSEKRSVLMTALMQENYKVGQLLFIS